MLGQCSTVDQISQPGGRDPQLPRPRRFRAEGRTVPAPAALPDPIVAVIRDETESRRPTWTFVSRTGSQTRLVLPGAIRTRVTSGV